MDTIPFVFCDSVVGLIKSLPSLARLFKDRKWNFIFQSHCSNRQILHLQINGGGTLSYCLYNASTDSYCYLDDFQSTNAKYLRITCISSVCTNNNLRAVVPNTVEQLNTVYDRLKPFMDLSDWRKPSRFTGEVLDKANILALMLRQLDDIMKRIPSS